MSPTTGMRVALLVPQGDTTLEADCHRSLPRSVSVHVERMWLDDVSLGAEERMLEKEVWRACDYLRPAGVDFGVFGCTSASALGGPDGERTLARRLSEALGCETFTAFGAVLGALERLEPQQLAVLTPYPEELTERVAESLEQAGFPVIGTAGMGRASDPEIGNITPDELMAFASRHRHLLEAADTVFVSCTNLRALECVRSLSSLSESPVTTTNLAILERLSELIGSPAEPLA